MRGRPVFGIVAVEQSSKRRMYGVDVVKRVGQEQWKKRESQLADLPFIFLYSDM